MGSHWRFSGKGENSSLALGKECSQHTHTLSAHIASNLGTVLDSAIHQQALLTQPPKHIQNLPISQSSHCYGPGHHHVLGPQQQPSPRLLCLLHPQLLQLDPRMVVRVALLKTNVRSVSLLRFLVPLGVKP